MAELDKLIQNLYESSVKGTLPERQAQRMIQQYDEEQILLERRVEVLKSQIQYDEVKEAETGRFIALVKKYKDYRPERLYAIDKLSSRYRRTNCLSASP